MATLKQIYNITVDIFLVYFGSGNKVSDPQHSYASLLLSVFLLGVPLVRVNFLFFCSLLVSLYSVLWIRIEDLFGSGSR